MKYLLSIIFTLFTIQANAGMLWFLAGAAISGGKKTVYSNSLSNNGIYLELEGVDHATYCRSTKDYNNHKITILIPISSIIQINTYSNRDRNENSCIAVRYLYGNSTSSIAVKTNLKTLKEKMRNSYNAQVIRQE